MPLVDALASADLTPATFRVVTLGGREIAIVRIGDGLHAFEEANPHDGTSISGGRVVGTELRCANGSRFDLSTGACLRGGEDLRRFHVRDEDGRVLVQLDEPLAEVEQARVVASLRTALIADDRPRLARECVRLLKSGAPSIDVVRAAVRYGAERCHGGFSNALASCADYARIAPLYRGLEQALPLTQALVGVARANRGRGQRPIPAQARGVLVGSADARRAAFVQAVEERDAERAEAMLSGALYQGLAISEAAQWLFAATCVHVVDGGRTIRHVVRALELCDQLGGREAIFILPPLVPPLVWGARDDTSGALRDVGELLDRHADTLPILLSRVDRELGARFDDRGIRSKILEGTPEGAFEAARSALIAGVPPARMGLSIVLAAAERVLRFDELAEWDDGGDCTWDDGVQPFLVALAAQKAVERWQSPETVKGLVFAAALVQRARELDVPDDRRLPTRPLPASAREGEAVTAIVAAVRTRRPAEAVGLARGYIERGHDPWRLAEALAHVAIDDATGGQDQIERAAAVVVGAVDAWEAAADHPDAALPLFAATRVLASDSRQRWVGRQVTRALRRLGR